LRVGSAGVADTGGAVLDDLEFRVLGPVEVTRAGAPLDLGPRKQRSLLAVLLVASPEVVSVDALLDRVWGEHPPRSAPHALQVYVSNLRKLLEPGREAGEPGGLLVTRDPGYALTVPDEQLDARRFETLVRRAGSSGDPAETSRLLEAALALWRGPALVDVAEHAWAAAEAARLDGLRLNAMERRFDAELGRGRHAEIVHELEATARQHPLRERFWEQLMLALYRCGRQVDALRAYREVSRDLAEALGLDPGPDLVALEAAVLRHDPALACSPPVDDRVVAAEASNGEHRDHLDPEPPEPGDAQAATKPPPPPATLPADGAILADGAAPAGTTTSAAGSTAEDERRIVTVLFADLVGSTVLGTSLGPDEFKLVVDDAVRRMVAACEQFGGRVVNIAGDGLLALFGAPVAHEDDPERAVLAGLRLLEEVAAYGEEVAAGWGVDPLQARVGITTGPVVTGLAGAGEHVHYSALGDTVNTAARLESAASPGTVLVDGPTRDQLGPSFTWSDPRWMTLKGKSDPVVAYEATAGRPGGGRPRGIEDRPTRLHSRHAEIEAATGAIEEVLAGRGSVLVVTGAPGMGKSRLVSELREACERRSDPQRPLLWLQGTCLSYGDSQLLWPLREIVTAWLGVPVDQPELRLRVTLRSRVEALFDGDTDAAGAAYTALAAVLGVDEGGTVPLRSSSDTQASLHDRVCGVFEQLARDRPLVIALDDLHWADGETLRLLARLAERTERAAVLLVLASRAEPGDGAWDLSEQIRRDMPHRSRRLELGGLDRAAAASLLEDLTGSRVLPPDVRDELLELSEGNPFYLEELLRTLMADGALIRDDAGLHYRGGRVRLPASVEQVVVSRLDRVDRTVRSVLTAAAVLGREFDRSLLEPMVELPGGAAQLDDALIELQRLALVREVRRWPEPTFGFEHALIREAAYDTLTEPRRQELHRRAAVILAGLDDAGARAAEIGHHWERACDDEQALDAYRRAGEAAERRGTLTAASSLYAAALEAASRLGADRVGPGVLGPLVVARWSSAAYADEVVSASEELADAVAHARAARDAATEARALETLAMSSIRSDLGHDRRRTFVEAIQAARRAGDPAIVARMLGRLAIDEANDLDLEGAHTHAVEAMEISDGGSTEARMWALDARKLVALYLGELDVLGAVLDELEPILAAPELTWLRRYAVVEAAVLDLAVGAIDAAEGRALEALELSRQVTESDHEAFLAVLCGIRRARGDYGAALGAGRRACELAHASGAWWVPWAAAEYGSLLIDLGRHEEATECLRHGVGFQPAMPSQEVRCSGLLALAAHRGSDLAAEQVGVDVSERLLRQATFPMGTTYLYGADGMLALAETQLARGAVDTARERATAVSTAAEDAGWLEPAARARHVLGLAALERGETEGATAHLQHAIELAEGVLPGRAWRSHAALGQVGRDARATTRARQILHDLAGTVEGPERDALLASLPE
jgi:class 3 adenylate cyclase/DNA-binding SARP family transcriptional activator/tetratricopeptide (TPR) repeat protein